MTEDSIVLRFRYKGREVDLDVPGIISAQDFIVAVNETYNLGIDTTDVKNCHLQTENPIALLKGNKALSEFGIHNGTIVYHVD